MASQGVVLYGPHGEQLSTPATRHVKQRAMIRARFDAAQTTNENTRHWANADYLGPNSELDPSVRRTIRSRARYECANNTYAGGMVDTLANDTIGTGPVIQITAREISKDDATAIENLFWEWCLAADLPQKLRLMRSAKARDGESFAQFFSNPRIDSPVRLDLSVFEADLVAATQFNFTAVSLLDGLFIDDFGNVVAYNVLRQHPGENYQSLVGKADIVPARDILHLFNAKRPGQYRGVSEITPALPLYAQLRRFTLAVIRASESAAIPSWLLETQQPPSEMDYGEEFDVLETERGMGVTLPAGYKMSQLKAEHPTTTYPGFKREIIAEIARCLGMPYNVAAGDSSSYNYSSGRLDHRTYYKSLRIERAYFENKALDRIFRLWWDEAYRIDGLLPYATRQAKPPAHEWRWDGDEHVDPTKEIDAAVSRVAYGFSSLDDEIAILGRDRSVVHHKNALALGLSDAEYAKRLADKFFGAQVASSSQQQPEQPPESAANPSGGSNA